MARQRLTDVVGRPRETRQEPSRAYNDVQRLLIALRSHSPGPWTANLMELSRHFTSAVYIAVNTLATHASRSTFHVFERTDDPNVPGGEIELPWTDPVHELIENPNPEDTFADVMYQSVQQLSLTGMSLTWVVPGGSGPAEFYNLPTANCWPLTAGTYDPKRYPHGGYRVIPYTYGMISASPQATAAGAIIPAEQVMRLKNPHPFLRYDGYAVLTAMGHHVDTFEAIGTSRFATMRQGAEQSLQLKATSQLSQDPDEPTLARTRKQLELLYAGPENANKIVIPPAGWEFSQISTTPKDMAWTEGFMQLLDFVLASFGVPKAVAGLQDSSSYATLYASLRAFGYFSLGPIVGRIEARMNKDMIRPAYGREFGVRLVPPEFRDEQLEVNQLSNDLKSGAITYEEYRTRRKWSAIKEPWTKDRVTANFVPQQPGAGGEEEGGDPLESLVGGLLGGGDGGKDNSPESSGPRTNDPNVDNARPTVQKRNGHTNRVKVLERLLERAKTNGHAMPIGRG